jgi:hypothetical protein
MRLKIALSIAVLMPAASLAQTNKGSITYLTNYPPCTPYSQYTGPTISGSTTCGVGNSYATGTLAATGGDILTAASSFGAIQQQTQVLVNTTSYVTISDPGSIFRVELRSRNLDLRTTVTGDVGKSSAFVEYYLQGIRVSGLTPVAQFASSDRYKFNGGYGQQNYAFDQCLFCPYGPSAESELFLSFLGSELSANGIFMLALQGYADATTYGGYSYTASSGQAYGSMDGYDIRLFSRDAFGVQHDVTAEHTVTFNPANPAVTATPEPATLGLMATGLVALLAVRRRRKAA